MATQVSLNSGAIASAGALAIQTNGTTQAVSISTGQVATLAQNPILTSGTINGVVYLNGSKAVTSGSVLVFDGTSLGVGGAPASKLDVSGTVRSTTQTAPTSGAGMELFYDTGGAVGYLLAYNRTGAVYKQMNLGASLYTFGVAGSTAMALDSSGNLVVGKTSTVSKFEVNSGTNLGGLLIGFNGTSANFYDADSHYWRTGNGTGRASIDSSGNLLVNKTSSGIGSIGVENLANGAVFSTSAGSTNATSSYNLYSTGAAAYRFYVGMDGTINATSIVITAISDQRLKENVRDIDTGLNEIMSLKPRRFDWKEGKGQDKKDVAGFIAQEFETVFPECVSTSKAGADGIEYKNINHETLIPTLVKAIQELKAEIDSLKSQLNGA